MTAEQARAVRDVITGSIEQESVAERKVIAAIPANNRDYKPDPKSRSAWEIAVHVAMSTMAPLSQSLTWPPTERRPVL